MQSTGHAVNSIGRASDGHAPRAAPDAFDILEQFGCTVAIRRSHEIYRHNEPADHCWKIVSGCARKVMSMEDGRRQVREFGWPGDLIGMDDVGTYFSGAEAVTDMTLRRYPRHVVDAHAKTHAALALRLWTMTLVNLRFAHKQINLLARRTAVERIASFLLDMDRQTGTASGHIVDLPMNRTDIADHLGLSIETVCRNLVNLQRDGTVVLRRAGVQLVNRAALLELACETRH